MTPSSPSSPTGPDVRPDLRAGGVASFALLIVASLLWLGSVVLGRAVSGEIPPIGLAFWRWLLATAALLPFAAGRLRRDWPALRPQLPLFAVLAFFGVAASNVLLYAGLRHTTSTDAALLQSLLPVAVFGLAGLARRAPIRWASLGGMATAFGGTLLIVFEGRPSRLAEIRLDPGDLLVLAGVVSYAVFTLLLPRRPAVHPLSSLLALCLLGVSILLPFYLLESALVAPVPIGGASVASFLYLGLGPSLLAYLFYDRGVRALGARRSSLVFYLNPVLGAGLSMLLLGEALHGYHAVGAALIALGVWSITRSSSTRIRRNPVPRYGARGTPPVSRAQVQARGADPQTVSSRQ